MKGVVGTYRRHTPRMGERGADFLYTGWAPPRHNFLFGTASKAAVPLLWGASSSVRARLGLCEMRRRSHTSAGNDEAALSVRAPPEGCNALQHAPSDSSQTDNDDSRVHIAEELYLSSFVKERAFVQLVLLVILAGCNIAYMALNGQETFGKEAFRRGLVGLAILLVSWTVLIFIWRSSSVSDLAKSRCLVWSISVLHASTTFFRAIEVSQGADYAGTARDASAALHQSISAVVMSRFAIGCAFGSMALPLTAKWINALFQSLFPMIPPAYVAWSTGESSWLVAVSHAISMPILVGFMLTFTLDDLLLKPAWIDRKRWQMQRERGHERDLRCVGGLAASDTCSPGARRRDSEPCTPSLFHSLDAYQKYRKYQPVIELGRGSSGRAIMLLNSETNHRVVSKELWTGLLDVPRLSAVEMEVRNLSSMQHPNIIRYLACFVDFQRDVLCIITEIAEGGNLRWAIQHQARAGRPFATWQVRRQDLSTTSSLSVLTLLRHDL